MRVLIMAAVLVASAGAVLAQASSTPPKPAAPLPSAASPGPTGLGKAAGAGKSAVDTGKAECISLWDAGTHMSKQEWATTCARIQTRLDNLKIENLDLMGTGGRKKPAGRKQSSIDPPGRWN